MGDGGVPDSAYVWIERELAWFGVAATVVAAPGATREQVAAAYGLDLSADPEMVSSPGGVDDDVSILDTGEGSAFAIEVNGWRASQPGLIERLSEMTQRRVAAVFWNVNAIVTLGCADGGSLEYRGELEFDRSGFPEELGGLLDRADDRAEVFVPASLPYRLAAMEMLEAWTGMVLTPEIVRTAAQEPGYLLRRDPP